MNKMFSLLGRVVGVMMLAFLVACGGDAAVAPDVRMENMFTDMNAAFSDANFTDAAKQEEWADKLSKYFVPEEQATQKASLLESFQQMSLGGELPPGSIKIENVDVETVSETGDTAEVRLLSGKMVMDIPGLGNQEFDLAEGGLVGDGENATLRKVDGVWYIVSEE